MAIKINLNKDFRITSDPLNYILEKRGVKGEDAKNPGEEVWKPVGFYTSLSNTLEGYQKHKVRASDVDSLKGLFGLLVSIQSDIQVVRDAFKQGE